MDCQFVHLLFLAHNFWLSNTEILSKSIGKEQRPWTFLGNNIAYYFIDESIDIHEEKDLYIAMGGIKDSEKVF